MKLLARPSIEEERWLYLAVRLDAAQRAQLSARTGAWRHVGLLSRVALFVLGLLIASLLYGILDLLNPPAEQLLAALLLLSAVEWLISVKHLDRSGIEESLTLCGSMLLAWWLIDDVIRGDGRPAVALCSLLLLLAGWRVRNAAFTTLAAVGASLFVAMSFDSGSWFFNRGGTRWAAGFCFIAGLIALALGGLTLRRPSSDRRLDWLVVAMPMFGYLWLLIFSSSRSAPNVAALATLAVYALSATFVALRRRRHAPLWACLVCLACCGFELRSLLGPSHALRLLVGGCAALLMALALNAVLRNPRRGITSARLEPPGGPLDALELAGAAALTPLATAESRPTQGAGGGFGGGGADGRY